MSSRELSQPKNELQQNAEQNEINFLFDFPVFRGEFEGFSEKKMIRSLYYSRFSKFFFKGNNFESEKFGDKIC